MNKIAIVILLLSAFAWAGSDPIPAEYTINIHVNSSRIFTICGNSNCNVQQQLNVVIDGRKYELESYIHNDAVLALGDYKAKLVKDEHKTTYESSQTYEFLFSDKKVRKFRVVGQTE